MRTISIQEVKIEHFRSFVNQTITFPITTGLKLLTGNNISEQRLGSNGAGKSSLWDAIVWSFYGTSVKGSKVSSLLSWGTEQAKVTIKLLVNGQLNTIHRYGPPVKVEVNGILVEQDVIDRLLGLSKLRFLHSVIFGQGIMLFPDLSIPERGALLDEILDLSVWQKATDAASAKHFELEKTLLKKKSDLTYVSGKIASLQTDTSVQNEIVGWDNDRENQLAYIRETSLTWKQQGEALIATLEKQKEEWKTKLLEQIEAKALEIEDLEAELAPIKFKDENVLTNPFAVQIRGLETQLKEINSNREKYSADLHQCQYDLDSVLSAESFWKKDNCPVCNQLITQEKKKHELESSVRLKQELQKKIEFANKGLQLALQQEQAARSEHTTLHAVSASENEKNKATKKEVLRIEAQVAILEHEAKRFITQFDSNDNPYEIQIVQLKRRVNPYEKQKHDLLVKVNPFIEKLDTLKKERKQL